MRGEYFAVAGATLVYLVIDIYPSVKSFTAIVQTFSFWLLWIIFSLLNVIAWAALWLAAEGRVYSMLNDHPLTSLVIVILSTLCTLTILQSLSVKIADYKFIDVGLLIESFRKTVLSDIGDRLVQSTRRTQQRCADRLFIKYQNNLQGLRDAYANTMSFGGRTLPEIGQELANLEQQAAANNLSVEPELALRIAKADIQRAKELLRG
jgi:predicted PurR-regulated permease PerM